MKKLFVLFLACLVLSAGYGQEQRVHAQTETRTFPIFRPALSLRQQPALPHLSRFDVLQTDARMVSRLLEDRPEVFELPVPGRSIELELQRVEILTEDFSLISSDGGVYHEAEEAAFYRGRIKGIDGSLAAVSIFPEGVQVMYSAPQLGDHHIARHQRNAEEVYILYADKDLKDLPVFDCYTEDTGIGYRREELAPRIDPRSTGPCVRLYLEVDHDVFLDKGSLSATENYIKGLFNEVAALYATEKIRLTLSQVFVWTTPSPYSGDDIYTLLQQFQRTRTAINGDVGQLLTYKSSGGIAFVDILCRSATSSKLGVSSIDRIYRAVPSYSFSVLVVAHELGHLLGSQHTHACVWNGNNTAIDGCPGYTEGSCAVPGPLPTGAGTIMSYCHISSVGINLSNGFGPQPGNLIRNRIAAATCLQTCTISGPDTTSAGGCDSVLFSLVLDSYGSETTWQILNAQGQVLAQGGPYADRTNGRRYDFRLCLPYGCYTLLVKDTYGDGICCSYGSGSFRLTRISSGQVLASGGQFTRESRTNFCLQAPNPGTGTGGGGTQPANCIQADFSRTLPKPYGAGQDFGKATVLDGGRTLLIENNAWKAIDQEYTITPETRLAFDYRSTLQGEIHGIGMDSDDFITAGVTFQLHGTQAWGIQNYRNYDGSGNWKSYVIPIGKFYTGKVKYLFFAADHDINGAFGNAYFRYVRIYEGEQACPVRLETAEVQPEPSLLNVAPNPASEILRVQANGLNDGPAHLTLYNFLGQQLETWPLQVAGGQATLELPVRQFGNGAYVLRLQSGAVTLTQQVMIQR